MADSEESRSSVCEGCGASFFTVKKIYKQQRYCSTCYARLFKRRACPRCASVARLPTFDSKAVCQRCLSGSPCVRCGRTGRRVGRMTPYGPACNSCAHYFTQPQPCEICGTYSTRRSRVVADGRTVKACPKCARIGFETCALCRRNRQLTLRPDGRKLCWLCSTVGTISCWCCGADMPAGVGKECNECYWQRTFRKRVAMDVEALRSAEVKDDFLRFGDWLPSHTDYKKAARSINRYLLFFREVEKHCSWPPAYSDLLTHFGAESLRRTRLPVTWLIENRGVAVDGRARALDSEQRRIEVCLASGVGGQQREALSGYYSLLMSRVSTEQTSLRSVRLALSTATSLLIEVHRHTDELPDADEISRFLRHAPGRMASLTGFIHYLNLRFEAEIDIQILRGKAKSFGRRNLEHELFTLFKRTRAGEDVTERWILVGLKYFYSLTRRSMRGITVRPLADGNGFEVSFERQNYWIPSPCDAAQRSTDRF